jgi:hypothetical protein
MYNTYYDYDNDHCGILVSPEFPWRAKMCNFGGTMRSLLPNAMVLLPSSENKKGRSESSDSKERPMHDRRPSVLR